MKLPFRIVKRDSFRVVGYRIQTTNKRKEGKKMIPAQWKEFREKGQQAVLLPLMNQEPYGLFGISVYNTDQGIRESSIITLQFPAIRKQRGWTCTPCRRQLGLSFRVPWKPSERPRRWPSRSGCPSQITSLSMQATSQAG